MHLEQYSLQSAFLSVSILLEVLWLILNTYDLLLLLLRHREEVTVGRRRLVPTVRGGASPLHHGHHRRCSAGVQQCVGPRLGAAHWGGAVRQLRRGRGAEAARVTTQAYGQECEGEEEDGGGGQDQSDGHNVEVGWDGEGGVLLLLPTTTLRRLVRRSGVRRTVYPAVTEEASPDEASAGGAGPVVCQRVSALLPEVGGHHQAQTSCL